ncbi:MAG: zinc ribbon domain-containing protein [Acidobacteriaceae bacterium]|nr:zinc ribbon domain-containing protein [Acidobacteriaceae bacterium]
MPIFEYVCKSCGNEFEAIVRGSEKSVCPKCEGTRLEKKLSVFAMASSSGTGGAFESMPSSGGGCACGDPNGPCSMDED